MKLVSWNIRAGGGRRALDIVEQLRIWDPDTVVLSEFRGTGPSQEIAATLRDAGLPHQRSTCSPNDPAVNALLVASRWPMRVVRLHRAPVDPRRWLHVKVAAPETFAVLAVHVPNRITGRKYPFLRAVTEVVKTWRGPPALVVGDTNSGRIDLDEESAAFNRIEDEWIAGFTALGWLDAFRALHGERREFTWYSPNGNNGFRLDQAFLSPHLTPRLQAIAHQWGGTKTARRDELSDHAALLLDFDDASSRG